MDGIRFDRLVTSTSTASRRRLLGGIATLALAGWGGEEVASAKKRCRGVRKCGKKCCPQGQVCSDPTTGACVTPTATNPDPICAGINSCCSTRKCGKGCLCQTTIEGGGFCTKLGSPGCGADCTSSDQCPDGVCISYAQGSTCNGNTCCAARPAVCVPNSSRCS